MDSIAELAARFVGGPNAPAHVCLDVWDQHAPILCVTRTGNVWYFRCGHNHRRRDKPVVRVVAEIVERDPMVASLATLNEHHIAWRKWRNGPWLLMDEEPEWEDREHIYWWP